MADLLPNLMTLAMLTLLQGVLGLDNLLYISLESKRAPADQQARVRRLGIGLAIGLRIALLFILESLIGYFKNPVVTLPEGMASVASGSFNVHSIIVLLGGIFIIYTAMKEIFHMIGLEEAGHEEKKPAKLATVVFWIVAMNIVFSFDSILSAMALSEVFWVKASAIIIGGILMIWLSDTVSLFLQKNRLYEVLGLFILFIVGIMLLSEGAHLAHLKFFKHEVTAMSKATFYFVIAVLVLVDIVQGRYQRKLLRLKEQANNAR
ncbi:MAG: putative tellurium resistance membrane protein TerC [Verrucomicrobiales bacterium]|jgi:predicted tellurium resistance membrane protein TerC